jgi:hypothetical protein
MAFLHVKHHYAYVCKFKHIALHSKTLPTVENTTQTRLILLICAFYSILTLFRQPTHNHTQIHTHRAYAIRTTHSSIISSIQFDSVYLSTFLPFFWIHIFILDSFLISYSISRFFFLKIKINRLMMILHDNSCNPLFTVNIVE